MYGITKRDQEELALVLGRAYGVETVALRYLNVYGPRQALGNPYTGVAAIFAARLLAGRAPLVFEDGGQIRDLVHVSDVVRATLRGMDAPAARRATRSTWPPGAGSRSASWPRASPRALGSEHEPEVTGQFRAGDIRHCFADVTLARELLGSSRRVRRSRTGSPSWPAGWPARRSASAATRRWPSCARAGL